MEKAKPSRRDIQFYSKKNQTLVIVHSQWAYNYANQLEEDDNVALHRACEPLVYENFELESPLDIRKEYWPKADGSGAHWETNFYIEFADGRRAVREIVRSKEITHAVAEQLELSRRYWAAHGSVDWKSILFEKPGKTLGDGEGENVCND